MEADDQHRQQRIVIETPRHRITGLLTLAREGYRSRVSDVLNAIERDFISLTDATVELLDSSQPPSVQPFVAISRAQVVLAILDPAAGLDD